MRFYLLLMFLLFAVIVAKELKGSKCIPNQPYEKECRQCTCDGKDKNIQCNLKYCRNSHDLRKCKRPFGRDSLGRCRDCFCGTFGYMAECPKLNCPPKPKILKPLDQDKP